MTILVLAMASNNVARDEGQQREPSLEERLEQWREEQHNVASQVIVREDSLSSMVEHERFKCLSLLPVQDDKPSSTLFGGVDVSFPSHESDASVAVYVVLDCQSNKVVYHDYEYFHLTVPYVSSYLSFREIEPLVRLVEKQRVTHPHYTPRAILVDGNGILHARGAGIACFLGVRTNIPTIGVGKSLYCQDGLTKELVQYGVDAFLEAVVKEIEENARWREELKDQEGQVLLMDKQPIVASVSPDATLTDFDREACVQDLSEYCQGLAIKLQDDTDRILAAALLGHGGGIISRQTSGTKVPIYISVGHNVSLEDAVRICTSLSIARIPEPVRQADLSGRELLRA